MTVSTTDVVISLSSAALATCGAPPLGSGEGLAARTPITGERLGTVPGSTGAVVNVDEAIER
ncbi:MAG: aldehyde dehydrogenase family protein, partial [Actinomycetota bacterium]